MSGCRCWIVNENIWNQNANINKSPVYCLQNKRKKMQFYCTILTWTRQLVITKSVHWKGMPYKKNIVIQLLATCTSTSNPCNINVWSLCFTSTDLYLHFLCFLWNQTNSSNRLVWINYNEPKIIVNLKTRSNKRIVWKSAIENFCFVPKFFLLNKSKFHKFLWIFGYVVNIVQ